MTPFENILKTKSIIVLIGAGGVGKTTTSIATAIAAARLGRKVALLSIDPAKRLADALGIPLGSELSRIIFPQESGIIGSVSAAMLDQKVVFDKMVREHSPSTTVAERILRDPLYKAASTNLAGPLEYMALARLRELADDSAYDLVVLDTPPDTHALDFLARPNLLQGFMDNKVLSWLVKPFLMASKLGFGSFGRFVSIGEKLMGGMAKVTGVAALRSFGEFLVLMREVIEGFHKAGERVVELLKREQTAFVLVTVPTNASARSAEFLSGQLKNMSYRLSVLIFNRCLPVEVAESAEHSSASGCELLRARSAGEGRVTERLRSKVLQGGALETIISLSVPEQSADLHNVEALLEFSKALR